jgi:hypothetical protein
LSLLIFEFSVLYVSALQLHVNDADLLVNQDIFGRARDNPRYAQLAAHRRQPVEACISGRYVAHAAKLAEDRHLGLGVGGNLVGPSGLGLLGGSRRV